MATVYKITDCGPTAMKFFAELRGTLPHESYPNGNSGWKDRMSWIFEAAGYVPTSEYAGCPAAAGHYTFTRKKNLSRKEAATSILAMSEHACPTMGSGYLPRETREYLERLA